MFGIKNRNAGDTKVILSDKGKERKKRIDRIMKKGMEDWKKVKFGKCVALDNFGGLLLGHPQERTFQAREGQTIRLPQTQIDELKAIGRVE